MCGRYTQTASPEDLMFRFGFSMQEIVLKPRYNLAVVGYDNHWPKGHHRHVLGEEGTYDYRGIDALIAEFNADVARVRRRRS